MEIEVLGHASVKLSGRNVIYIDPYNIEEEYHDADYIFITHDHYDHYDKESIEKVRKPMTMIIVPTCMESERHILAVEPNQSYHINRLEFTTVPAYNIDKPFHPKDKGYVGYNILLEDKYYYIMGDTDRTPETDRVKADICFVPIGGTYTMNVEEAAAYINDLKPEVAIPIHYGSVAGKIEDGEAFKQKINEGIQVELKLEEN